ncbi:uncharacterized protein P174DRAFT_424219 [Aspergillus novofumigatus IBT 16806]|uniref:AAA+ ATPase domain-containing protein n=1 Tax=Aspergillus novofumigatus (strain IBT 16806) TaxID=1392255 RepID=A0A2I1BXB2_ASPN1|nr:uncharacterized protein P174DRAFT_424219 [Aspergillus novofumigatus IBT 16806]PKX90018.1 hypothetical protein P174DRAFT_424219 [Aspergillus novofumigatus IBT 16806]
MVSAKWHPPYAEDQPYAHLILTTHVLDRGFQAGSVLGVAVGIVRALRSRTPNLSAASIITRSTGSGAFLGACTMAIMLPIRMAGKERIEWQDRAWRLLENKGQVEVDNWTTMGMVAGVGTTAVIMRRNALRLQVLDHLKDGPSHPSLHVVAISVVSFHFLPPIPRKPQPSASVSVSTQTVPNSRPPSVKVHTPSPEEELQAHREIARSDAEDWLQSLVGQDNVKRRLNEIQTWISICQKQGKDPKQEWYNIVLEGNEGTGKTTVARIYANILFSTGITDMLTFRETSGAALAAQGPEGLKHLISGMVDAASPSAQIVGVLLVEDAHLLTTSSLTRTQEIFDALFEAMERTTGRVVVVLSGHPPHMEGLVRLHPRLERTICCTLRFTDFSSNDYLTLLGQSLQERYNGKLEVAGGLDGPFMQMAARRLVRAAAGNGPRNVHAVQRLLDTITLRHLQSHTTQEQDDLAEVDTFFFSPEDILGPRPADVLVNSRAWADLQKLVGQEAVKASVSELLDTIEENFWREARNQRPFSVRVNRIFVGPPGTGKSTVARLYGQVLADVGLLSSGEVVEMRISQRPDVKDLLNSSIGKVLLVDVSDLESSQTWLKTLITQLSLTPRHDRCVVLVGTNGSIEPLIQEKDILKLFREHHIVHFHSFTKAQLRQILEMKLHDDEVHATSEALDNAVQLLEVARMRKDFNNGRAIAHLLGSAHSAYERSRSQGDVTQSQLERVLVPANFERDRLCGSSKLDFREELKYTLVSDDLITLLERYRHDLKAAWLLNADPTRRVPLAMVFKGATGIGRRSVARLIGRLYYDMGVLDSGKFMESSATDLALNACNSSTQTRSLLERARGVVLFIEDAHRLSEIESAAQAINDLVYLMPKYSRDTVVILAGSGPEMDLLLCNQPRLSSLFQEEVVFKSPTPRECLRLLDQRLQQEKIPGSRPFLTDTRTETYREFTRAMQTLSLFPCWSNARDIDVLAMWMVSSVLRAVPLDGDSLCAPQLTEEQAMACVIKMYNLKRDRLRYNQDPKVKSLPRNLSQPRSSPSIRSSVRFPV